MSAQCTSRVSTLLSHHLFASTNHGGCFIIKCVLLSTLSTCCGGGVGCVSSLLSPRDEVACCCEKRLMLFESLMDGIIRVCSSEPFENTNDLVSMVCTWDAFVEEGSAIGISLIQHSLHQCACPVFCFAQCTCTQSHSSAMSLTSEIVSM